MILLLVRTIFMFTRWIYLWFVMIICLQLVNNFRGIIMSNYLPLFFLNSFILMIISTYFSVNEFVHYAVLILFTFFLLISVLYFFWEYIPATWNISFHVYSFPHPMYYWNILSVISFHFSLVQIFLLYWKVGQTMYQLAYNLTKLLLSLVSQLCN